MVNKKASKKASKTATPAPTPAPVEAATAEETESTPLNEVFHIERGDWDIPLKAVRVIEDLEDGQVKILTAHATFVLTAEEAEPIRKALGT